MQASADKFSVLTAQMVINKLNKFEWRPTSTGIPGVSIADLNDDDRNFLYMCSRKHLVKKMNNSESLGGGEAYYCYQPAIISKLLGNEGFAKKLQEEKKERLEAFSAAINELGDCFSVCNGRDNSGVFEAFVNGDMVEHISNFLKEKESLLSDIFRSKEAVDMHFSVRDSANPKSSRDYRPTETELGKVILGCATLIKKGRDDVVRNMTARDD